MQRSFRTRLDLTEDSAQPEVTRGGHAGRSRQQEPYLKSWPAARIPKSRHESLELPLCLSFHLESRDGPPQVALRGMCDMLKEWLPHSKGHRMVSCYSDD